MKPRVIFLNFLVFVLLGLFNLNALAQKPPKTSPDFALRTVLDSFQAEDGEYLVGFDVSLQKGSELNRYLRASAGDEYASEGMYWRVILNISNSKGRPFYRISTIIDSETGKKWK